MEDVSSKSTLSHNYSQLTRPMLPIPLDNKNFSTLDNFDVVRDSLPEDLLSNVIRNDDHLSSNEANLSNIMAMLGQIALSQGMLNPVTTNESTYPFSNPSADILTPSPLSYSSIPNFSAMSDMNSISNDALKSLNWLSNDNAMFQQRAPDIPFSYAPDRQLFSTSAIQQNASNWSNNQTKPNPNFHSRSMSAQNINMSGVGQVLKNVDLASGLIYRHGKQLSSDQVQQRGRYGSNFTSIYENENKNNGIESDSSILSGNQSAVLLDLLRNMAVSQPNIVTNQSNTNELRNMLKETNINLLPEATYAALSLVKSNTQIDSDEVYSRKVFVGGLPPDIDEEEILGSFHRFGSVIVDWPHKAESKSYFPPKGYCFLLFDDERSVQQLVRVCIIEAGKLYWHVSSPTMKDKAVQIRPWKLSDCDFVMDGAQPLDPRKTVFVGGVPRPMRAIELAMAMGRMYGPVCYAGIDTDPDLKYPKGAGRVTFMTQQSFLAAINSRFVQLQHADIDKRVEVKPYVLEDQICDECQGLRSGGKHAPFFCANVVCLQYYCDQCWAIVHSSPGREFHKPLVKDGADRPRTMPFRMC